MYMMHESNIKNVLIHSSGYSSIYRDEGEKAQKGGEGELEREQRIEGERKIKRYE